MMTAAVLVLMGGWFIAEQVHADNTWWIGVERIDSSADCVEQDDWPDSLLEGEMIDLNTATPSDLARLPGIGATRAQAIAQYRQEHGPFTSVDELIRVNGIGPGVLEILRTYVTAG